MIFDYNLDKKNNILEDILNISSKIFDNQNKILDKISKLEERIIHIENNIEISINSIKNENLKELKNELLDINKSDVIKALLYRDYRSVIYIFKFYYKNKNNKNYVYPIKVIKKRTFEYYDNNKWNSDLYGYHSINVLCLNVQNLFMKYNNLDEFDTEDFILNQEFIYKLSDKKYKKEIFKNIIEEIQLNNI